MMGRRTINMSMDSIDPRAFRDAMGCFASAVTVISTTTEDGQAVGVTETGKGLLLVHRTTVGRLVAILSDAMGGVELGLRHQPSLGKLLQATKLVKGAEVPELVLGPQALAEQLGEHTQPHQSGGGIAVQVVLGHEGRLE